MTSAKFASSPHICFFGVGVSLTDCYSELVSILGREPDFLCDNASGKWGASFHGIGCISPEELAPLAKNTSVVITVRRYEPIWLQLKEMGVNKIFVACFDRAYDIVSAVKPLAIERSALPSDKPAIQTRGRWTLVTGASRGIGRKIALEMAGLGSNVILHCRREENAAAVAATCADAGVQVKIIAAELGDDHEVERMLEVLLKGFPPVDFLFNNAALSLDCGPDPFNISSMDFSCHYAVNTIAPIRIAYRLIPGMKQRGFGRIVNISSTIQKQPLAMAYACSKAALNKFVHDLAPSLKGTGVAISLTCPGFVRTDMGGPDAPCGIESVAPGVLLGAVLDADVNGRWFLAQDYSGLSLNEAMAKARFYHSL